MRSLVLLCVCIVATACAGEMPGSPTAPATATSGSARAQSPGVEQLPFHGSMEAVEVDVVVPPSLQVNGTGTGTATHLGLFTSTFTATVSLATSSATGRIQFIAANGDRLDATFLGQGTPTAQPGVVSVEEVATVTGGTGRFANAGGEFTIRRVVIQATGVSTGSFDGTLDLGR